MGIFCIISFLTRGTSLRKKRAKKPAVAPKDAAVMPLLERIRINVAREEWEGKAYNRVTCLASHPWKWAGVLYLEK